MKITADNIPASASRAPTSHVPSAADKATAKRQALDVRDSYSNSTAIIDAEYVEFYSPSTAVFDKERRTLDDTLEPQQEGRTQAAGESNTNSILAPNKYQLKVHAAPPPGSFIDTFA